MASVGVEQLLTSVTHLRRIRCIGIDRASLKLYVHSCLGIRSLLSKYLVPVKQAAGHHPGSTFVLEG